MNLQARLRLFQNASLSNQRSRGHLIISLIFPFANFSEMFDIIENLAIFARKWLIDGQNLLFAMSCELTFHDRFFSSII